MEKEYALRIYLTKNKMARIEDWVNNTKSSYLLTKVEYLNMEYFMKNVNFNFSIENREGNSVFLKKINR
ncbi:MAG: hypothetical protein C3F06_10535 [Candidatus Methanoperedenaceae archaeon]|nr:MAG: hypothetical protein C3F06_10535 [Candidatus Methanoperedenaceae archaeon]